MAHTPTPEQTVAINHDPERDGALLLSAAAGSGKTSVIALHTARLLTENKCAPEDLIVVTFTDKAAKELQTRIADALVTAKLPNADLVAARMRVSTIHTFCKGLVEDNGGAIEGIPSVFNIIADTEEIKGDAVTQVKERLYNSDMFTQADRD
ncbi:MAG: UvrD-helicase domain-containing protein, partial [Oscillospiraceae bacterium]|nr:UvrD-helicase domain-containing protein [Oscillospiraceae bacterium]